MFKYYHSIKGIEIASIPKWDYFLLPSYLSAGRFNRLEGEFVSIGRRLRADYCLFFGNLLKYKSNQNLTIK